MSFDNGNDEEYEAFCDVFEWIHWQSVLELLGNSIPLIDINSLTKTKVPIFYSNSYSSYM